MPRRGEELFGRIISGQGNPLEVFALRVGARAASRLYGLGATAANAGFDFGLKKPKRLPAPVIGIGNLSVGGSGKTPLVAAVVESLQSMGIPAGVISRGYGGSVGKGVRLVSVGKGPVMDADQAGDEPVMLARRLKAPVAVGSERFVAGQVMLAACGPRVLVGDDLFQHRRLHRDLDIAVLPCDPDPRSEAVLPRGRLREPLCGLRRARVVVLSHAEDPAKVEYLKLWLRSYWGPGPVLACRHRVRGVFHAITGKQPDDPGKLPLYAFCGLGRPEGFRAGLDALGLDVRGFETYGDHHRFGDDELAELAQKARDAGAKALVTSEKDWARLGVRDLGLPLWVTRLSLEFDGGNQALAGLLARELAGWRPDK